MQGLGFAPYYNECQGMCEFIGQGTASPKCLSDCELDSGLAPCYEDCSGKEFYTVCDFICDDDATWAECYGACSGEPLDTACDASCEEFALS